MLTLQAQHRYFALGQAGSRSGRINGNIAAADNHHITIKTDVMINIGTMQEGNSRLHALTVFTRYIRLSAAPETNGKIESLVAVFAQLINCHIFANFASHTEFHAHLLQDINLSSQDVLFQHKGRNTIGKHAAWFFFFVKDGDIIASFPQIVRTGNTRRTGTDDSHLIVRSPEAAMICFTKRYIALIRVKFLHGNELLDLINRNSTVNRASGALLLTALVADIAAHSR